MKEIWKSFRCSLNQSHDYKPTLGAVRSPLLGKFLAGIIFLWRISSLFQLIKTFYKTKKHYRGENQDPVNPLLAELYVVAWITLLVILPIFISENSFLGFEMLAFAIVVWKAFETLCASLYYHAFRDFFEIKERISGKRSFLLSIADLLTIFLSVSAAKWLLSVSDITLGSVDYFMLSFSSPRFVHLEILLSIFVWLQVTVTLSQAIGFLGEGSNQSDAQP